MKTIAIAVCLFSTAAWGADAKTMLAQAMLGAIAAKCPPGSITPVGIEWIRAHPPTRDEQELVSAASQSFQAQIDAYGVGPCTLIANKVDLAVGADVATHR